MRKTNAGNAFYAGFHRGTHGTTINNIDAVIGAMVDTAQTDIGFAVQYFIYGKFNTIHRCAAGMPGFNAIKNVYLIHAQRFTDRDSMSHTTLWFVGRHYHYFAQWSYCFYQASYTGCSDAVIIGDQY